MNVALLGPPNFDPTIPRAVVKVLCARHLTAARTSGGWFRPDDHPQVESDAPCGDCRAEAEYTAAMDRGAEEVRVALMSPKLAHTRFRGWCGQGAVYVYHRDETSPTGVLLAASCEATRYDAIAAELRGQVFAGALSPLSPTEGMARV